MSSWKESYSEIPTIAWETLAASGGEDLFRLEWENSRIFEVQDNTDFIFDNVDVYPDDDNTLSLGRDTKRWSSFHAVTTKQSNAAIGEGFAASATIPENGLIVEGAVGVGTATPDYALSVKGDIAVQSLFVEAANYQAKNFQELPGTLSALRKVRGFFYETASSQRGLNGRSTRQIGLKSEDIEQAFPELVATDRQGVKAIDYKGLVTVLLEAIKELEARVESIDKRVSSGASR